MGSEMYFLIQLGISRMACRPTDEKPPVSTSSIPFQPPCAMVREVGLRDGLQSIATVVSTARKLEWIRAAHAAGQREIEVGSFVPARLLPQLADTAEVLATIVNTVGPEKLGNRLDATTRRNIRAAAQQEKNHYELLTSKSVGGKPATTTIYVPDEVFSSPEALLTTLAVGDQVFINAYLLANTVFARQGDLMGSKFARYTAEIQFMIGPNQDMARCYKP